MLAMKQQMLEVIRDELSYQRIPPAQFANKMGISLRTLQRWMTGECVDLEVWLRMLSELGLSFNEVASRLDRAQSEQYTFNESQEESLAKTPGLLAFFIALFKERRILRIQEEHDLSITQLLFYLEKLNSIRLIRWDRRAHRVLEGPKIEILTNGEPKWRVDGALSKKFRATVFDELIAKNRDAVDFKIEVYQLTEDDADRLNHLKEEYFHLAKAAEKRATLSDQPTKMYAVAHYFTPYAPQFLTEI